MRAIQASDFKNLIGLLGVMKQESPVYRHVDYSPEAQEAVIAKLTALHEAGTLLGYIDWPRGVILGFIGEPWYSSEVEAYEQLLYVHPRHRDSGVAAELLHCFERGAKDRGAVRIQVGTSAGIMDRDVANFYMQRGYCTSGRAFSKDAESV